MLLGVFLDRDRVGEITVLREVAEFRMTDAYRASHPRPILGQVFEDDLEKVHRSRVKLPPFFSNLLPEGALRNLLAKQIGVNAEREPFLIAELGEDLPGAVRVVVEDATHDEFEAEASADVDAQHALKFSLAGIQLKLSAIVAAGKMTIPVRGQGGDWIVKLPHPRYPEVPANEWSMMTLAKEAGIDVPEVRLVKIADVEGLPEGLELVSKESDALAIRRFDRTSTGRVHMEDFAQVLDLRPSYEEKYKRANFETITRILSSVAKGSVEEMVKRLVFNAAIGNGDAHVKNWSLLYHDRRNATLSPAYDLVSTIQHIKDDDLGLNLGKSKKFDEMSLERFEYFARRATLSFDVPKVVRETVAATRRAWTRVKADLPVTSEFKQTIERHWARVPIMSS